LRSGVIICLAAFFNRKARGN